MYVEYTQFYDLGVKLHPSRCLNRKNSNVMNEFSEENKLNTKIPYYKI